MNINAKIDWTEGMDITPQTFIKFDESLEQRGQRYTSIANGNLFGLIPYTPFECQAIFVRKSLEIERLQCMALLPSGRVIHVDERVELAIPMLYEESYYLTVSFSTEVVSYKSEDLPYVRPQWNYALHELSEIEAARADLFPVMKFKVTDGLIAIDDSYIPPYLHVNSAPEIVSKIERYVELLTNISEHANLESGDAQRTLLRYAFCLRSYNLDNRVRRFAELTQEIAQTLNYYIIVPNGAVEAQIERCTEYDISSWLIYLEELMQGAVMILDKVVLEDKSIDLERLKAELRDELYEKIYGQIESELNRKIRDEIMVEIEGELRTKLTDYINSELRARLTDEVGRSLSESLSESLYEKLYEALYDALYVATDNNGEYMPLI